MSNTKNSDTNVNAAAETAPLGQIAKKVEPTVFVSTSVGKFYNKA